MSTTVSTSNPVPPTDSHPLPDESHASPSPWQTTGGGRLAAGTAAAAGFSGLARREKQRAAEEAAPRRWTARPIGPRNAQSTDSLSALDLQIVSGTDPLRISRPGLDNAPLHLESFVHTSDEYTEIPGSRRREGASTQKARVMQDANGNAYRCKFNPKNRPRNTFADVVTPRIWHACGFAVPSPVLIVDTDNRMGEGADALWVGSPLVEGFKDLGRFLVESGADIVKGTPAHVSYLEHLDVYHAARRTVERLLSTKSISDLLRTFGKGGFDKLTLSQHETLQPLRNQLRRALQSQDRMLGLLPGKFHHALSYAFYLGEAAGNWDLLNHERWNTGFVVDADGSVRAVSVDWGNTGPSAGFGGRLKRDSLDLARMPARIEDPFARIPDELVPSGYMASFLRDEDLDYETVSRTFGALGMPRASVAAVLQRDVIERERELEPSARTRHGAPDAALEVAWHLSLLPPGRIERVIEQIFAQGTDDQVPDPVRQLFSEEMTGFSGAPAFATHELKRIDALIARANEGGQLKRWVQHHPVRAAEIQQRVAVALGAATPLGKRTDSRD